MSKAPVSTGEFKHPSDGWYMIEPKGEHPNAPGGVIQVIDDEASQSIVNRFNTDAAAGKLRHGHDMLVDHEHFKHDSEKETVAYGWLTQLQNRADGIYGQVRWTGTGKAAVDGGDYRFFSTEYLPKDLKILNDGKVKRVRPLRLDGLTLTNMHNNRGQRAITNRASLDGPPAKVSTKLLSTADALQAAHDDVLAPVATWFNCLKQVRQTALNAIGYNHSISASELFNIARTRYPKEFAAMYGTLSDPASTDDSTDVQVAQQQMTDLTNRIATMLKCSFISAYGLAQSEFPRLVNRLTPQDSRIVNRNPSGLAPKDAAKTAARIINRMIAEGVAASGHPHSVVFSRVMATEPIMGQFAAGQISAGKVLTDHPELWERLASEA
jgi:hypothetical protein